MEPVVWLVVLAAISLIPAKIAQSKGRGFWTWYVFALLVWIVAMVASLVIRDNRPRAAQPAARPRAAAALPAPKKCPECAETVLAEARVCKHCGFRFAPPLSAAAT